MSKHGNHGNPMASTIRKRQRQDLSQRFKLPTVALHTPMAANPKGLALPLFDYQRRSLHRMLEIEADGKVVGSELGMQLASCQYSKGGVVADTVGMGKTAQVIALMLARPKIDEYANKPQGNNLIVTPNHLCRQWQQEIDRFAPQLKVVVVRNLQELMATTFEALHSADCVVTSLGFLKTGYRDMFLEGCENSVDCALCGRGATCHVSWHAPHWRSRDVALTHSAHFREIPYATKRAVAVPSHWAREGPPKTHCFHEILWHRVILDECHEIVDNCDVNTGHMTTIVKLPTRHVWCVTGTPFPKGDKSMYGIHSLLGLKLKLHVSNDIFAKNKPLEESHPFEFLKRKFYLQVGEYSGNIQGTIREHSKNIE
jgi:SNF2 family DNA or RNA helicase